ncbi:MAG: hypothetical protein OXD44_08615 [Gammaproteobacteria bacterium]|nr:hypothetical protein [Gammaproteobacteria bacterium]
MHRQNQRSISDFDSPHETLLFMKHLADVAESADVEAQLCEL